MSLLVDNVAFLEMEYADLRRGVTSSGQVCPKCNGGSSREGSFNVSRDEDGVLRWMCHRASCGFRGAAGTSRVRLDDADGVASSSSPSVRSQRTDFKRAGLDEELVQFLNDKYRLTEQTLRHWGLAWTPDYGGRVILPVKSHALEDNGVILRSHSVPPVKQKTLTFTNQPHVMAWFVTLPPYLEEHEPAPLVIVEDIYSALRLWQGGINAVALLGTHLNEQRVAEIAKLVRHYPHLKPKLALDYDAFGKAIGYSREFRHLLRLEVVKLTKDIKDLNEDEFNELSRRL